MDLGRALSCILPPEDHTARGTKAPQASSAVVRASAAKAARRVGDVISGSWRERCVDARAAGAGWAAKVRGGQAVLVTTQASLPRTAAPGKRGSQTGTATGEAVAAPRRVQLPSRPVSAHAPALAWRGCARGAAFPPRIRSARRRIAARPRRRSRRGLSASADRPPAGSPWRA